MDNGKAKTPEGSSPFLIIVQYSYVFCIVIIVKMIKIFLIVVYKKTPVFLVPEDKRFALMIE